MILLVLALLFILIIGIIFVVLVKKQKNDYYKRFVLAKKIVYMMPVYTLIIEDTIIKMMKHIAK